MSNSMSMIGGAILVLLLAGYLAQQYGLPPPKPKIVGIDLGTTFSSIGIYHAVTGRTTIIADDLGKKSVPSVVAFLSNGSVLVGTRAVDQQEKNPQRTIYDAKRFIGKVFQPDDEQFLKYYFQADKKRYPFTILLDKEGRAYFEIPLDSGNKLLYPEEVGSIIIEYLKEAAEKHVESKLSQAVISVPAEFTEEQRNFTAKAAELAGLEVRRVISEPTAAALAYGLHKKQGIENVVVVDLGGGTLDVSVLWLQGGTFVTQAMAGNNRLGGQDFNNRVQQFLLEKIKNQFGKEITNKEDLQTMRLEIERAKLRLTAHPKTKIQFKLVEIGEWSYEMTRDEFKELNDDLLKSIEQPMEAALQDANLDKEAVDEVVLVGGSTRLPAVRRIAGHFFGKPPNFGVDPELAVVTGAAVQAGVIGGGWPLQVAAMELQTKRRKRHFYTDVESAKKKTEA
ncbi:hypothetical protein WR25_14539 [Diploscapter pachys]|uniref:Heat shock 70 kDa protein 13 n=2 Tax=Diploscapter pachys TaxID=2018661 RepID=A0A2A2JTZ3_9BILA|nr:hypothetical protein WR25_14539 [Diploscapter pachys]